MNETNLHYFENKNAVLHSIELKNDSTVVVTLTDDTETVIIHLSRKIAATLGLTMTSMLAQDALDHLERS